MSAGPLDELVMGHEDEGEPRWIHNSMARNARPLSPEVTVAGDSLTLAGLCPTAVGHFAPLGFK